MEAERFRLLSARPQWPDRGHPDENVVYAAVGRCLTAWEACEGALASVYARLVSGLDETPALFSFGAVRTFEGRLGLLRMAYRGFMMNREGSIFDVEDLLKVATSFAPRRNEVAHGSVRNCYLARPDKYIDPDTYCLFSGYADSEKAEKVTLQMPGGAWSANTYMPKYAYTAEHMIELSAAFNYLRGRAGTVSRGIALFRQNGTYPEPGSWI